ncbi:hypothetical protein [Chitinivibrio alkaliphilus]|uniref:Uncharacterized protein n=1 Tax=Chitinivibrio alkaliphilus ACht1 TaxID=1313304 RepID=U7D6Z2_9BACT|nr:hypothetical protein [Chitinivibrio alkaliphilus]ERP38740.1 hypothetical protein CALK_0759 [Chitinivibrio alkaliphilus ACht1]
MSQKKDQARENLSIIRDTLDISEGARYFRIILLAFGTYFMVSAGSILATIILLFQMHQADVAVSNLLLVGGAVLFLLTFLKVRCIQAAADKNGVPLGTLIENSILTTRFIAFYTPHIITAVTVITYLIYAGHSVYVIPALLFIFGYSTNSMGVLFHLSCYTRLAYLFIGVAVLGLFFLMGHPWIFAGLGFGVVLFAGGVDIAMQRKRVLP